MLTFYLSRAAYVRRLYVSVTKTFLRAFTYSLELQVRNGQFQSSLHVAQRFRVAFFVESFRYHNRALLNEIPLHFVIS